MADDVVKGLKLSQQLVMTPQLQMAIRLLGTPSSELAAWVAQGNAGVAELGPGDVDPFDDPGQFLQELERVCAACRYQTIHGLVQLAEAKGKIRSRPV